LPEKTPGGAIFARGGSRTSSVKRKKHAGGGLRVEEVGENLP